MRSNMQTETEELSANIDKNKKELLEVDRIEMILT